MGYTHYFTQLRDFTMSEWDEICEDLTALFAYAQTAGDIRIANGEGDRGTGPEINKNFIAFNGSGDDSHETFIVRRKRLPKQPYEVRKGSAFCKTARKPYDTVVTAVLCYFCTITESHVARSDGKGSNFLEGLDLARKALSRYSNRLDIPLDVMKEDRWCGPWIRLYTDDYAFNFSVDGKAYIQHIKSDQYYCFPTHKEAAEWAMSYKDATDGNRRSLFDATGFFNQDRIAKLKRAQNKILKQMVRYAPMLERDGRPLALVRPNEILDLPVCYSLEAILNAGA